LITAEYLAKGDVAVVVLFEGLPNVGGGVKVQAAHIARGFITYLPLGAQRPSQRIS